MFRLNSVQAKLTIGVSCERSVTLTLSTLQSNGQSFVTPVLKSKVRHGAGWRGVAWERLPPRLCTLTSYKAGNIPLLCRRLNLASAASAEHRLGRTFPAIPPTPSSSTSRTGIQRRSVSSRSSPDSGETKHGDSIPAWKRLRSGSWVVAALVVVAGTVYAVVRTGRPSGSNHHHGSPSQCQAEQGRSGSKTATHPGRTLSLEEAVAQATDLCQKVKDESGSPGLVVAVSVDGQLVWTQGMGYADVENRVPCKPESVMRIASISKSITMAAVAKAMENGDLDIDKPVQYYVPQFPEKTVDGEKVVVTTRQLVSHMAGIRHYEKDYMKPRQADAGTLPSTTASTRSPKAQQSPVKGLAVSGGFTQDEYYIKDKLDTVEAALAIFKDDPLVHKPGSKFLYSTHGWTLISAVLEGATKKKFPDIVRVLFHDLGLDNTYLDENEPLIYNRARFYVRNKAGSLENAPYVDCSYKYAGGGFLSTVTDIVHFGNAMLYSFQRQNSGSSVMPQQASRAATTTTPGNSASNHAASSHQESEAGNKVTATSDQQPNTILATEADCQDNLPGYLKPSTVQQIWKPASGTRMFRNKEYLYAMGWETLPEKRVVGFGRQQPFCAMHTGAAVGASSILLIVPSSRAGQAGVSCVARPPQGVTVAIFVNMIQVSLRKTALNIAQLFERVSLD